MKASHLRNIALAAVMTTSVHAQTIDWGSDVDSVFIDSQGYTLGSGYVFELGAFWGLENNLPVVFVPTGDNMADWYANWHVFDSATAGNGYNQADGYLTSTAVMTNASFNERLAYLWIRNDSTTMEMWGGSEWLLVRSAAWNFPEFNCCDPALLLEWSVSDLVPDDAPLYGYQKSPGSDQVGTGDTTFTSSSSGGFLQTGTYLPEPSSAVMVLVLGAMAVLDRRRRWHS